MILLVGLLHRLPSSRSGLFYPDPSLRTGYPVFSYALCNFAGQSEALARMLNFAWFASLSPISQDYSYVYQLHSIASVARQAYTRFSCWFAQPDTEKVDGQSTDSPPSWLSERLVQTVEGVRQPSLSLCHLWTLERGGVQTSVLGRFSESSGVFLSNWRARPGLPLEPRLAYGTS
jgi:hypothetical protein